MTNAEAKAKIKSLLMAEIDRLQSHYDSEIDEEVYSNTAEVDELLELNKIVCNALEKQIPKKPVNYDSVPHSRCPVCNNSVKVYEDAHEYHYCLYCGQRLNWSKLKGDSYDFAIIDEVAVQKGNEDD